MRFNSNMDNSLAKAVNKHTLPKKAQSYELCIKADAMRFSKLYKESVKTYLDAIMMDRSHEEAYWGLASSYKYLQQYHTSYSFLVSFSTIVEFFNVVFPQSTFF